MLIYVVCVGDNPSAKRTKGDKVETATRQNGDSQNGDRLFRMANA